ncbi:uncharacterized protein [Chironomus tepperi]|uniref:uncharacterized protein n=1 Tax=Chironomus tepperi TaxID=113505 RepID=UPI00391F7444
MESQAQTSYQTFLEQYYKEQELSREITESTGVDEEIEDKSPDFEDEGNKNETDLMISKLCRVCGNRGQIYIYSTICDKYLTIPKTRLSKALEVTIAEMIEQISSEKVEKTDLLPQFICPHCLSYLQHAYNVRLEIIHTSKNLTEARKIANDESLVLETNMTSKPLTANQQEIINTREEIEGDKYWFENFDQKNVKIKIQTPTRNRIDQRKVEEIKCPGCFKKSYGAKSHNEHMNNCLINVLKIFFGEFQTLYKARFEKKITQEEYLINTISLIFNYTKKIQNVAKRDEIDIEAISKILPVIPTAQAFSNQQQTFKSNGQNNTSINNYWNRDRFASPDDNGYYSNTQ